jgi:hypothetical protein
VVGSGLEIQAGNGSEEVLGRWEVRGLRLDDGNELYRRMSLAIPVLCQGSEVEDL